MGRVSQRRMAHPPGASWHRRAWFGAVSGVAGGTAFALAQRLDIRAFHYPADDFLLLGGVFGQPPASSRRIGIALHAVNSAAVGAIYGMTAANLLRLPGPAKGTIFALIENAVLYPAFLLERHHPLIKSGKLPSYRNWTAFTQEVLRHVAFGATTGALYSRLSRP